MITITPIKEEFYQKIHTIYSINNPTPNNYFGGSMTTSEACPYCKTRNIFKVFEPKEEYETNENYVSIYDCKCPICGRVFDIVDEFEKEED